MQQNLTQVQRRAAQYWFIDGLAELGIGLFFLLLGAMFWFWDSLAATPWGFAVFFLAAFGAAFAARRVIQGIKERSTYPRTGYAAPVRRPKNRWTNAIFIAFIVLILVLNFAITIQGPQAMRWSAGVTGMIIAFILGWTAYLTGLRRFAFLAVFSLAAGVGLALLGLDSLRGAGALAGSIGLLLLLLGGWVRQSYLRQNLPMSD